LTGQERDKAIENILINELLPLMQAKSNDYSGEDIFSNLGDFGWKGVVVRIGDKYHRLKNFCRSGELKVSDENIEDTLKDLINYSFLALIMKRRGI